MARLKPFIERKTGFKESNLGKVILFCEGRTEENYFKHFAAIIRKNKNKYARIEIIPIYSGGNAQRVLDYAEDFFINDDNLRRFGLYEKYLVFDCDAPQDIQQVIQNMLLSDNDYQLLPSNLLFETWLLMHFELFSEPLSKVSTYKRLARALSLEYYGDAEKVSEGIIRQIIGNGDSLRMAINNALELEKTYAARNLTIENNIREMNPYTAVHKLMEMILAEMQKAESNRGKL